MYHAFTCCIILDLSFYCSLYKLLPFYFICLFKQMCVLLMCMSYPSYMYFSFLFFIGIWENNLYKCCVICFLIPMYAGADSGGGGGGAPGARPP